MQGAQSSDYRQSSLDEAIPSSNEVMTSAEEECSRSDDKDTLRNIVPQPTDGTDSSNEVGQENRHRYVRKHRYFGNRDWKLSRPREHLSKNNVKGVRRFQKLPYTHDKGDYINKGILQIQGQGHRYNKQGGQVNRVQKPDQTCSKEGVNMEQDLDTDKNCNRYTEGEIMKGYKGEVHKNSNKPYGKEGDTKKRDQEPINQSPRYTDPVLNALNNAGEANTTDHQSYENISMIVPIPHKEAEDVQSTDIDDKNGALPEMTSTVDTDQILFVTEKGFKAELKPGEVGDPGDIQDETAETEVDYYEESTVDLDEEDGEEATTYDTIDEVYEVTEKGFTVGLKPGEVGDPGDIEDDADYEDSYDDEDFFDATEVVTQPIDPQGWYGWSLWSACSVSCGKGQLTRKRLCGACCEDGATQEIEIKPCQMPPCRTFSLLDFFRPRGRKIFC